MSLRYPEVKPNLHAPTVLWDVYTVCVCGLGLAYIVWTKSPASVENDLINIINNVLMKMQKSWG